MSIIKNMKIRGYRNIDKINGRIINATISKELDNKYYVSIIVEEDITDNNDIIVCGSFRI